MPSKEQVQYAAFQHEDWNLYIAATEQGVCMITLPNESFETLEKWVKKRLPGAVLVPDQEGRLQPYIEQLREYFRGERQEFAMPFDFRGTPFQIAVWQALYEIPLGTTCSYSDIATRVGKLEAVRAVGAAIGANPIPIVIPCHRVIGKNGSLTGFRGGLDAKRTLLKLEGLQR